jgi:hypothetical protein
MKSILFVAHDPGGFNLLIPVINSISRDDFDAAYVLLAGSARNRSEVIKNKFVIRITLSEKSIDGFPNEFDVEENNLYNCLNQINPSIVLTGTSINSNIERFCFKWCRDNNTVCAALIDSWTGKDIRFISKQVESFPSHLLVADLQMKNIFEDTLRPYKIILTGNPYLEWFKQSLALPRYYEGNRIVFFCENILHYTPNNPINEFNIIQDIISNYSGDQDILISIRPHPMERRDTWVEFIEKHALINSNISLELDNFKSLVETISESVFVMGISTTALIESSIFGKKSFSYQVNFPENSEMLYLPFNEYGIQKVKDFETLNNVFSNLNSVNSFSFTEFPFNNSLEKVSKFIQEKIK